MTPKTTVRDAALAASAVTRLASVTPAVVATDDPMNRRRLIEFVIGLSRFIVWFHIPLSNHAVSNGEDMLTGVTDVHLMDMHRSRFRMEELLRSQINKVHESLLRASRSDQNGTFIYEVKFLDEPGMLVIFKLVNPFPSSPIINLDQGRSAEAVDVLDVTDATNGKLVSIWGKL
jgi:hypothetical protein